MRSVDLLLAALAAYYLHRLPDFRGKWRLLRPLDGVLSGVPVPSRYAGVKLALDVADRTNKLCVLGRYDDVVPNEVGSLKEGECLVDVGANCGLFTIMAGQRVGRSGLVIAFEPCLATYATLASNLSLNQVGNVVPLNMAVAERFGVMKLDVSTPGHSGRYSIATAESTAVSEITAINLKEFPGICALLGTRKTLIKIDVEGYELHVLRGIVPLLERPQTRRLVVEIDAHNLARYGAAPGDIYALLAEFGFTPATERSRSAHYDEVFVRTGPAGEAGTRIRPTGLTSPPRNRPRSAP